MKNICLQLTEFRLAEGLTTREFAKIVGVSPSMVGQVENGQVADVRPYLLKVQKKWGNSPAFLHKIGVCQACQGTGFRPSPDVKPKIGNRGSNKRPTSKGT